MLSIPQNLVDFVALSNTHSEDYISDIKTDLDLLSKKFCSDKYKEQEILSECLPKLAYLCSKAGNKIVAISDVSYLFKKDGSLPFRSRVRYALNHLFENDNDKLERLNRVAKSYGAGELVVDSNSSVCSFKFSCNLYRDFFAAEHYANVILEQETLEDLSCLNECIINEQIARIIAYNLKEHKNWITDILSLISKTNRENCLDNLSEPSEYIFLTTNMVNILYYFKNSFEYSDFTYLDLRLCNFIGKNCKYAFFNHAFLSDQNFVGAEVDILDLYFMGFEHDNIGFFTVSENGEYFATGNSGIVNIRSAKYPMVIYRIITDEDKLSAVYFSGNEEVKAVGEKFIFVYNIKENFLQRREKTDDNIVEPEINDNYNKISEEIKALGKIRYFKEHFAIIQTDADSYYGSAYLLFDVNEDKLLSCHSLFVNKGAYRIAYDHDSGEVEFIPDNDWKPLRTICYNEKTNSIYYKQYPSMIGRKVSYSNGLSIYFDTDNFDSYLKYFFFPFQKKWDVTRENVFNISDIDICITFSGGAYTGEIYTRNCSCSFETILPISGVLIGDFFYNMKEPHCASGQLSCSEYVEIAKDRIFVNLNDNKYTFSIEEIPSRYYYLSGKNTDITKSTDGYVFHIGRDCWSIKLDSNKKRKFQLIHKYELNYISEYLYIIENFPWKATLEMMLKNPPRSNEIYGIVRERINSILSKFTIPDHINKSLYIWYTEFANYFHSIVYNSGYHVCNTEFTNSDIMRDFKNCCNPCHNGICYYNGLNSCYVNYYSSERDFFRGAVSFCYTDQNHYFSTQQYINGMRYYKLWDIYRNTDYNMKNSPVIPFANLDIYNADFKDSKGLSGGVERYVLFHTKIDTLNVD